jgi:hypothetical protein
MTWWANWGDLTLAVLALYGPGLSTLNSLQLRAKERRWLWPALGSQWSVPEKITRA